MKFKKVLCLITSVFMIINCCVTVGALPTKRHDKRKIMSSRSSTKSLDRFFEPRKEERKIAQAIRFKTPTSRASVPVDGVYTVEKIMSSIPDRFSKPDGEKSEVMAVSEKSEISEDSQKVLAINPTIDYYTDVISVDDIGPDFSAKVPIDSVYYRVSEKLKEYYKLWHEIECRLLVLKHTLPAEKYSFLYTFWWQDSVGMHSNIFLLFSDYMRKAYRKAINHPDVVLGREDYQIKIIEYMQKEWTLEGKFFCMEILVNGNIKGWMNAERNIDLVIIQEREYLVKLMACS